MSHGGEDGSSGGGVGGIGGGDGELLFQEAASVLTLLVAALARAAAMASDDAWVAHAPGTAPVDWDAAWQHPSAPDGSTRASPQRTCGTDAPLLVSHPRPLVVSSAALRDLCHKLNAGGSGSSSGQDGAAAVSVAEAAEALSRLSESSVNVAQLAHALALKVGVGRREGRGDESRGGARGQKIKSTRVFFTPTSP